MVLETDRLTLREADEGDAAFILALLNSPGFIENIGDRGVRTEAEAAGYVRDRVQPAYALRSREWPDDVERGVGMWTVVERATGASVGLAGLVRRDGLDCHDLGYAFLPQASGRGYATEAARAVLGLARSVYRIGKLAAITTLENHPSMAVLRKVGFVQKGTIQLPGIDRPNTYFVSEAP